LVVSGASGRIGRTMKILPESVGLCSTCGRPLKAKPRGKRAIEPGGEGVSIVKDEVKRKESSPSPGAAELELVRWTQSDGGAEQCCEP
jgi:hypothetical protein